MLPASVVLIVLLVVWAGLLFGGYILGRPEARGKHRMPRWTRLGSSLVLVLAAWLFVLVARGGGLGHFPLLIAAGMTLGFIGDLFMARVIPLHPHVLFGMAAFGLGHVAYIAAGLRLGTILGLVSPGVRLGAWLLWLPLGAVGWYVVVFRGQKKPDMMDWAALPYSLLLATTAGVASGLALQDSRLLPFAAGAILFLFSDLMIAAKLFAGRSFRRVQIDDLIWLTYGPGQCLIVYTTAFLLA